MKRLLLLSALTALLAGLVLTTVKAQAADPDPVNFGDFPGFVERVGMRFEPDGRPTLIPALILQPHLSDSVIDAKADAVVIQARYIEKDCGVGIAEDVCRTHPITAEKWERLIEHLYNYPIVVYGPDQDLQAPPPGRYSLPAGPLTELQLIAAYKHVLRHTSAGGQVHDLTLKRFLSCRYSVSYAIGGSVGDENAGDIIQNCTDKRKIRIGDRPLDAAALRNISIRQLAYLEAVDPQVKVIVQQYCDKQLLRASDHYTVLAADKTRRVLVTYVSMCQLWFKGDDYIAVRAAWDAAYEKDQAWLTRGFDQTADSRGVKGTVKINGSTKEPGITDPTPKNPGDGVVGDNLPPQLTGITAHNSNVPVEQTPDYEFDKDGYALVQGGVVRKYQANGETRCVFQGYDGSLYSYGVCS